MTELQTFNPKLPRTEDVDPLNVLLRFDRVSDTLHVHLFGKAQPAVSVDVGPHLYLRIDVETEEMVGFQIDHFLYRVVKDHPAFLEAAELAGVPADEVAAIRQALPREVRQRAAVDAVFAQLAALSYPADADVVEPAVVSPGPSS